jgi:hypothetical protein
MPKTSDRQQLLLDTHVWLWLVLASEALGSLARRAISRAAYVGNLRIAEMTVWFAGPAPPQRPGQANHCMSRRGGRRRYRDDRPAQPLDSG